MMMSDSLDKIKKAFSLWKEGREKFNEAAKITSGGPESYYFEKIEAYIDALFDRFAPFKVNDRVNLIKVPDTDNGWRGCAHFLIKGAKGTVHEVDYRKGKFIASVEFDDETWIDHKRNVQPVSKKHLFCLSESYLETIHDDVLTPNDKE